MQTFILLISDTNQTEVNQVQWEAGNECILLWLCLQKRDEKLFNINALL